MIVRKVKKNGKEKWMVDCRVKGKGERFFGDTKEEACRKANLSVLGYDTIDFNDADKLAKHELGDMGTLLDAVRLFKAHRVNRTRMLLSNAIDECVKRKALRNRRPKYIVHLKHILTQFLTYMGDGQCSDVATVHINGFLDSRNWAASTRAGMRTRLSAFFSFCAKNGYCAMNPCDAVELESVERKRPVIFTAEQVHRLLDTALVLDPGMVPFFTLGLFCGIRPEELERLAQEPRAEERGIIGPWFKLTDKNQAEPNSPPAIVDIPAHVSKTRDRRIVEVSSNALVWLVACGLLPLKYSRKRRREICQLAKIKWHPDVMRHSFASYHIALHQSADKTAHELGHHGSTAMLFKHYKATVTKEDAAAYWRLEPVLMPVWKERAA